MSVEDIITAHADIVLDTSIATREEWLTARRFGIGGSDAATMLGLNPYSSPYVLWVDKTDVFSEDKDNQALTWGRRLEGPIGEGFAEDTGLEVRRFPKMLRSKEWPWATVNLDFVVPSEQAALEVKNVGHRQSDAWEDGKIPDHYGIQGQWECAVTGLPKVYFSALVGGQDLRIVEVKRDDGLIADMMEAGRQFWELVTNETPPAIDGSQATTDLLKAMYPDPTPGSTVDLPGAAVGLIEQRAAAAQAVKDSKEQLSAIDNALFDLMGDREIGYIDGTPMVTWKPQTRKEHVVKESTFRVLRFPKVK